LSKKHKLDSRFVGEIIDTEEIMELINTNNKFQIKSNQNSDIKIIEKSKIIALLGPPNSCKSVFLNLLRQNFKNIYLKYLDKFYIIRACPDGEGDWFGDVSFEEGKLFRVKNNFDDEFSNLISLHINEAKKSKSIILVDCGGKIDKKNQKILNSCTHSIIISSNPNSVPEWIGASKLCELKLLLVINSFNKNIFEIIPNKNFLEIKFGKLERGLENYKTLPIKILNIFNYE